MSYSFEGPKWPSPVITWSFAQTTYPSDSAVPFSNAITARLYQRVVAGAFQSWAAVSGLTFVHIPDSAGRVADIRVGFGDFAQGNEIGATDFTTDAKGNMAPDVVIRLQDPAVDPLVSAPHGVLTYQGLVSTLYQVALHEIGHALGLGHSEIPSAVMYPVATPQNTALSIDDENALRLLYPRFESTSPPQLAAPGSAIFLNGAKDVVDEVLASGVAAVMGPNSRNALIKGPSNLVFGNSSRSNIAVTGRNDTVIAGSGADTIDMTGAGGLTYGGPGPLTFINAARSDMLIAGVGPTYIQNDARGGTFFGSTRPLTIWDSAGGATVVGGSGGVALYGTDVAGNDVVFAAPDSAILLSGRSGHDLLVAGAGNDTLSTRHAIGRNLLRAGSGSDVLTAGAGSDTLIAGIGNATMSGGRGANVFEFAAGQAGGSDRIADFTPTDRILLVGYGRNETRDAIATQAHVGGAVIIRLSDNTTITLSGISHLKASDMLNA
jgi:Ca2+-binding RTX toxin-like protein